MVYLNFHSPNELISAKFASGYLTNTDFHLFWLNLLIGFIIKYDFGISCSVFLNHIQLNELQHDRQVLKLEL